MARRLFNVGELNQQVTIQEAIEGQDSDTGDIIVEWETVQGCESVPAKVRSLSVREFLSAAATQSKTAGVVLMRYKDWLTAKHRFLHRGKVLNIEGVLPDSGYGNEFMEVPFNLGVNQG